MNMGNLSIDGDMLTKCQDKWGISAQMIKCQEECGELVTAIAKELNYPGRFDAQVIITELADVAMMVSQLSHAFGLEKVQAEIDRKSERVREVLKDETMP